ncbi:SapC family protein [Luteimonas sp BLCC-B24]|uniref:SapC family protein n=1 Tax=Luteimonas sp. BLCC-B24 TaxID=3025317 RepID=UPI00234C1B51|nr:SapC family protein [Luteimonas sp. BLCC-B24]MDC7807477.1 SapC family protein [Luteimonas sp. BLCC-B24]
MARTVQLNNVDHRDLRVNTGRGVALGDAVMWAITFPAEFRNVQAHYPIVFGKSADGEFQPLALFGFTEGQNLFLQGDRWDATYIPLTIERQPFLIGRSVDELLMHIDLDHPRVGNARGEALFLPHGGTSAYLEHASSVLNTIHQGLQGTAPFVAALLQHDLLEPFVLDIRLDDGSDNRLSGYYTINEERLRVLDGEAFAALGRAGHLEAIYMMLASVVRFRDLIERVNRAAAAGR